MIRFVIFLALGFAAATSTRAADPVAPHPAATPTPAATDSKPSAQLATRLAGVFSNHAQSRIDFNFHDVMLHVTRIWTDRTDGPWLYVEQALAEAPTLPYHQQVYQLVDVADGAVDVRVFRLANPVSMTGAWHEPERFSHVTPEQLIAGGACTVHLKSRPDGSFAGGTEGKGCPSELPNATYATTNLTVSEAGVNILERGFAETGRQVWGTIDTGYDFKRTD